MVQTKKEGEKLQIARCALVFGGALAHWRFSALAGREHQVEIIHLIKTIIGVVIVHYSLFIVSIMSPPSGF